MDKAIDRDLWGDPIPPREEKRGRPAHEPTDEKRMRVAVLRAFDMSQAEIAAALQISEPTLRANYKRELVGGLAQKRAELLMHLWKKVEEGNVSAMKEVGRLVEKSKLDAAPLLSRAAKPLKHGKKEQALIDASEPGNDAMGELIRERRAQFVH